MPHVFLGPDFYDVTISSCKGSNVGVKRQTQKGLYFLVPSKEVIKVQIWGKEANAEGLGANCSRYQFSIGFNEMPKVDECQNEALL